jgi:hypothetical protein
MRTSRTTRRMGLLAVLLTGLTFAAGSRAAETGGDTTWYVILAESGMPIGHASREIVLRPGGRDIVDVQEIDQKEEGGRPTRTSARTVTREDQTGRVFSIDSELQVARAQTRHTARVAGNEAQITRETQTDRQSLTVALPPAVRFDNGAGVLAAWNPAASPRLEVQNFNVDAMAVERIVFEGATPTDAQGRITVLRKVYDGADLRGLSRLVLDRDHRIVEAVQPMFGTRIIVRVTDRETALRPHPPHQVVPTVMTKSPFRISRSAVRGHIRYRFAFRDGMEFALPQTSEQRVSIAAGVATVDVCDGCGPGFPSDKAALAHALKPTVWLQADHPKVRAMAVAAAQRGTTDRERMELLEKQARLVLARLDFAGHFSALDTLSRRAGDCTETAVLLAAFARAVGIPARVVNGFVYSRERYHGVSNAFMPHSWVIAWVDGKWRGFDAALDMDSTHIALTAGDGDARSISAAGQLAGLLEWRDMAEVRPRPTNRPAYDVPGSSPS